MNKSRLKLAVLSLALAGAAAGIEARGSDFNAEIADGGARVEVRGLVFELPARGRLRLVEGGDAAFLLSHNIRVAGENGMVAVYEDFRDDRIELTANTPERIVVRCDRSLGLHDYKGDGKKKPWDAARLVTDYVFRKDVPGVVSVSRLIAHRPYFFMSWFTTASVPSARFSVDGAPLRRYPVSEDFKKLPDGYRTRAYSYITGESPDGRLWYLGKEFANFNPFGDGKPGTFYTRSSETPPSPGRTVAPGEEIVLSAALGRLIEDGDLDRLRSLRSGDDMVPVLKRRRDWMSTPVVVRRGELPDSRPVAGLGWNGANDLGFALRLVQDEKGIAALAEVTDENVVNRFTGKNVGLGDSVHVSFADAEGGRTLDRVYSAADAKRTPCGYELEFAIGWDELAAAGIARGDAVRFNLCVADQDGSTDLENWMGVADGILGGRDPGRWPFLDLAGVMPLFAPERKALPPESEMRSRIDAVEKANRALAGGEGDEYISALRAMTEYFVDFMRVDLELKEGRSVPVSMMKNGPRMIDADYRYYILDRIRRNLDDLEVIHRELKARLADLVAGRVRPVVTVKHDFTRRPAIEDGGFKVDGRELLLIGPDTWTNSRQWRHRDVDYIARTGFNQMNVFYVAGTNRDEVARRAHAAGLYCAWGSCTHGFDVTDPTNRWPRIALERLRPEANIGCLNAPADQGPNFVYQISFPEQWSRAKEKTPGWAEGFRSHLKSKFGSLEGLNAALGSGYGSWTNIDFAAALVNDALKYESFVYRMKTNMKSEIPQQQWKRRRYGMPNSVHFSSSYNMTGLDPLVALTDFEALWSMFDITGFDGGLNCNGGEWAVDFAIGGFDIDFSRSVYPMKPVANNETHTGSDGVYREYPPKMTYLLNMLPFLLGQNASSVWNWANSRHTYGEYAFTRACTYREMVRCALDLRAHADVIGSFRHAPNPPFRILHSLPSMAERDPYMQSLYGVYAALSFTGWPVRFITERHLAKGDFKGARVIVVPDARRVSEKTFSALAEFRRRGGTVLVDGALALAKDQWGKTVAGRKVEIAGFSRFADGGSRTRFETLNGILADKRLSPPVRVTGKDGRPPFGVMWRSAVTPDGTEAVFLVNLARVPVEVNVPGSWENVLEGGRSISGPLILSSMDIVIGKRKRNRLVE